MVGLGDLAGGVYNSSARAVSDNGSIVVGKASSDSGTEAFRWVEGVGMTGLGDLEGGAFGSGALAISSDGSVVVGFGRDASGKQAMKWTQQTGMKSLKSILEGNDVDLAGWTLVQANGVSADGVTIVGEGVNPGGGVEAFIARSSGVLSPSALNTSLASMSQVGMTAASMSRTSVSAMMDVSHGAILNSATGLSSGDGMDGRTQFWVLGTLVSDNSLSGSDVGGEGGIGITRYLANGLSIGVGLFSGKRSLDTPHGGNQDTALIGPGVFLAYAPEADGLRLEGGGTLHYLDMDLGRGYANGAGSAQSSGSTQAYAVGLYGRFGWVFQVADRFALQPFAQYNWQRVAIDDYAESGGPFPASFDSRTDTSNRTRVGLEGQYAYSRDVDMWAWAAWDHSFESKGASMSGQLTGLNSFNYGGGAIDQNWGDTGVGVKWRPYEGFETFSRLGFGIDSQYDAEPGVALTIGLGWDI
jgi:probable HAF family extracellular repeat protein